MSFSKRQEREKIQLAAFEQYLMQAGCRFVRTGCEIKSAFVDNPMPDYLVINPERETVSMIELKNTPTIAKKSYDYCLKLDKQIPVYFIVNFEGKASHRDIEFYLIRARDAAFFTRQDAKNFNLKTESHQYVGEGGIWRKDNRGGSGQVYGAIRCKQNSIRLHDLERIYKEQTENRDKVAAA